MMAANIITSNQEDNNPDTVEMAGISRQEMNQNHSLLSVSYISVYLLSQGTSGRNSSVIVRTEQFGNCIYTNI